MLKETSTFLLMGRDNQQRAQAAGNNGETALYANLIGTFRPQHRQPMIGSKVVPPPTRTEFSKGIDVPKAEAKPETNSSPAKQKLKVYSRHFNQARFEIWSWPGETVYYAAGQRQKNW